MQFLEVLFGSYTWSRHYAL